MCDAPESPFRLIQRVQCETRVLLLTAERNGNRASAQVSGNQLHERFEKSLPRRSTPLTGGVSRNSNVRSTCTLRMSLDRVHHGLLMLSLRSRLALARCTPRLEHVIRSAAGSGAMHSTTGAGPAIAEGSATVYKSSFVSSHR